MPCLGFTLERVVIWRNVQQGIGESSGRFALIPSLARSEVSAPIACPPLPPKYSATTSLCTSTNGIINGKYTTSAAFVLLAQQYLRDFEFWGKRTRGERHWLYDAASPSQQPAIVPDPRLGLSFNDCKFPPLSLTACPLFASALSDRHCLPQDCLIRHESENLNFKIEVLKQSRKVAFKVSLCRDQLFYLEKGQLSPKMSSSRTVQTQQLSRGRLYLGLCEFSSRYAASNRAGNPSGDVLSVRNLEEACMYCGHCGSSNLSKQGQTNRVETPRRRPIRFQ